jgi:hypothetical protein
MAGGKTLGANLARHAKERLKLHVGVAIGAGDGRASGEVLIDEGADDASLELFLEVHDVMRKFQVLRYGLGVIHVIERAAAVLRGAVALKLGKAALVPELHGEADYRAALLLKERGDSGRVHSARHGYGYESALGFPALRQRVELGGCGHADCIISCEVSIRLRRDM